MRPPFDSSRRSRSRPRARNLTACVRRVVNRAPARPLKGAMGTSSPPTRGRPVSDKTDHGAILGGSRRGPDTLADRRSGDHENACRKRALPMQRCRRLPADTAPVRARIAANAIARPGWPRRSRSWQRSSTAYQRRGGRGPRSCLGKRVGETTKTDTCSRHNPGESQGRPERLARARSASSKTACPAAFSTTRTPVPGDPLLRGRTRDSCREDFHAPIWGSAAAVSAATPDQL